MRSSSASKPENQSHIARLYYSEEQLAAFLSVSVYTLRFWRRKGIGPPLTKFADGSSRCLYRRGSVEQWLKDVERIPGHRSREVRANAR